MIAKGPNVLNINAYTQGEDESQDYGEPGTSSRPIVDSKAIEDQFDNFVRELQKYDQILSSVAQNIDQISASDEHFITDFYPQFILESAYDEDQEKKIIASSDPQLAKVVTNLERANRKLKEEMKGWVFEYAKKTKLSETLLSENGILRKAIAAKNKEIVKLIEGISQAQNDQLQQLKDCLDELREENGVLLDHLEKIKEELVEKKEDETRMKEALEKSKQTLLAVEKESREAEDKEEHLSKMVALLEDSLQEVEKRQKKLEREKERLKQLKLDYSKDQSNIENKVASCQQDKREIERELKTKFETHQQEKNHLIEEIEQSTEKVQKQKQETRYLENEISRNERRLQEYVNINKDINHKNEENDKILEKLKTEFAEAMDSEATVSSEIDMLGLDINILKEELKKYDKMEQELQQRQRQEIKFLEETHKEEMSQKQTEQSKKNRELAMRILQQKSELSLKEKEIQRWELKILDKKDQIAEMKSQIKEIKNNQVKMSELRDRIREEERKRSSV